MFDGEPPRCRATGCRGHDACGKPVRRELEHEGMVTFLCPAHRVVLRSHRHARGIFKVACRHHAGQPSEKKCMSHRANVWGWEEMP